MERLGCTGHGLLRRNRTPDGQPDKKLAATKREVRLAPASQPGCVQASGGQTVKAQRSESNPLRVIPKLDESRDRRRVRRPLTDDELARLLAVADDRGRRAWYMAAAMAGLRRGDLQRLTWADLDFADRSITIRDGKAKRVDVIPMHPQLAEELQRLRDDALAMPTAKVFPRSVMALTVRKDLLRAGLAREETVIDADGEPVMIGKDKRRHPKTRIVTEDAEGRVIDLHGLRTTLGTNLARAGIAPQIAQRIMRHSDYRTTLKHYTVLGLADTTKAIEQLPMIEREKRQAATGTHDADGEGIRFAAHQQYPQQLGRETMQNHATRRETNRRSARKGESCNDGNVRELATECDTMQTAGDETRTRNIQLGRLVLYH